MSLRYIFPLAAATFVCLFSNCSHDEPVRVADNILGIWSPDETNYLVFSDDNRVHNLNIEYQDNESIGIWTEDVYYYEPGYNIVIYLSSDHEADVYQIVELTQDQLVWCWVDDIRASSADSIGQIIGDIIKEAQEGFKLDPGLYQYFSKVPEDSFLKLLESLQIMYPW